MSDDFTELRTKLDKAITYGRFQLARRLVRNGVRKAQKKEILGEIEYLGVRWRF